MVSPTEHHDRLNRRRHPSPHLLRPPRNPATQPPRGAVTDEESQDGAKDAEASGDEEHGVQAAPSRVSGKVCRMTASPAGASMAANMPWRTRATISITMLNDRPATTDARAKPATPISSAFFAPMRTATVPSGTMSPAITSR